MASLPPTTRRHKGARPRDFRKLRGHSPKGVARRQRRNPGKIVVGRAERDRRASTETVPGDDNGVRASTFQRGDGRINLRQAFLARAVIHAPV